MTNPMILSISLTPHRSFQGIGQCGRVLITITLPHCGSGGVTLRTCNLSVDLLNISRDATWNHFMCNSIWVAHDIPSNITTQVSQHSSRPENACEWLKSNNHTFQTKVRTLLITQQRTGCRFHRVKPPHKAFPPASPNSQNLRSREDRTSQQTAWSTQTN